MLGEDTFGALPIKRPLDGNRQPITLVFPYDQFNSGPNLSGGMRKAYIVQYSVDGARNATTGAIFENGPVIARSGKAVYSSFYPKPQPAA
ncbi:MAG: hypothetical protein M1140_06660 [Chloroflexi bacterium]|nr:hypothetical protein [Chloroflexota bacterium]